MRWNEHNIQPEKEEKPKKGEKKEKPRILAGSKDYDYNDLGKLKPMKGGNPWS